MKNCKGKNARGNDCTSPKYENYDLCFPCLVVACLVEERNWDTDKARQAVAKEQTIVVRGILANNFRSTATAIEMAQPNEPNAKI